MGMAIAGIPRGWKLLLWDSHEMETNVAGLPRRWNKIVWDSHGNVALLDSHGAHAVT